MEGYFLFENDIGKNINQMNQSMMLANWKTLFNEWNQLTSFY